MNWTSECPTTPGYYWTRNYLLTTYGGNELEPGPDIVHVVGARLEVFFTSDDRQYDLSEFNPAEWYGPIEPPGEENGTNNRLVQVEWRH